MFSWSLPGTPRSNTGGRLTFPEYAAEKRLQTDVQTLQTYGPKRRTEFIAREEKQKLPYDTRTIRDVVGRTYSTCRLRTRDLYSLPLIQAVMLEMLQRAE
jgi:hypothetical protein